MPLTETIKRPWLGLREQMRQRGRTRTVAIALTVCLLAVGSYWYLSPHIGAEYHWWKADRELSDYDLPGAVPHLQCCLQVWPNSGATHFLLGRTLRRQGDLVAARQQLQKAAALRFSPEDLQLEYHMMEAQIGDVRMIEPLLMSKYLNSNHPDKLLIYEALSKGFSHLYYLDDAYKWAMKWIENKPDHWYGYFLRGMILAHGESYFKANEDFERVLERRPDQLEARLRLADSLLHKKNHAQAYEHFQAALQYHPESAHAAVGAGRCLLRFGRDAEARDVFERLLAKSEGELSKRDRSEALFYLADAEWHLDQTAKALGLVRKAAALDPNNPQVNRRLAVLLRAIDQDAEAQHYEDKATMTDKTYIRLDEIIGELRKLDTAKDEGAKQKSVDLRYEAGTALLRIGDEQDGVAWLVSAMQLDPLHEPSKKALKDYYSRKAPLIGNPIPK
jgi:tetratricopeptide (TPR) repeat protein